MFCFFRQSGRDGDGGCEGQCNTNAIDNEFRI